MSDNAPADAPEEKRFGSNSYHYWHDHGKDRKAQGDVAPMPKPKLVSSSDTAPTAPRSAKPISKYSWADGKKFVSVYVDYPGIGAKADRCSVTNKGRSVKFTVAEDDQDRVLKLVRLNQKIVGSSLKIKDDQVVVKLEKEDTTTKWYDLHKTTARGVTESDSDDYDV